MFDNFTLFHLVVILFGAPYFVYLMTRNVYGKYEYHSFKNPDFWSGSGYHAYKPGHLKPIHFIKTIGWIIFWIGAFIGGWYLLMFLATMEI